MKSLKVRFENCYGIKKLEHSFDFSRSNIFSIYAPNGTMKTSFAKACKDFSRGVDSKDLVFPTRATARILSDESGVNLDPVQIFVIEPYDASFKSERITSLLVNQDLKEEYDSILDSIEREKTIFYNKLKQLSGLSGRNNNIEIEISRSFGGRPIFEVLTSLEDTVAEATVPKFSNIIYNKIFDEKVLAFLNTKDFKSKINDYIEKYNSLIDKSKYLKKGFNHSNIAVIQKNLKDNGFFKAQHSVNLFNGTSKDEIESEEKLFEIVSEEMNAVLNDKEIQSKFNEIDSKLTTVQLREFRDYLLDNKEITVELSDLDKFRKEIWSSYFVEQKVLFENLLNEYKKGSKRIESIIEVAKEQATEWAEVIKIFNKRFTVPFHLELKNQDEVILKSAVPSLGFIFIDKEVEDEKINLTEGDLVTILSQGEKRAFYLLNIIFEIRARKKARQKTLYIVDDIADSFDYKNKYAIIEYLKEIGEDDLFFQIILTHNFDFYRTIQSRILGSAKWHNSLIAQRFKDQIKLVDGGSKKITSPFDTWKENLNNKPILVATIPFVRNLVEFREGSGSFNFKKLTSLLHIKEDTSDIKVKDLKEIYEDTLKNVNLEALDQEKKVFEIIEEVAEALSADEIEDSLNLENKIALSIAIRLKAEVLMWSKVTDKTPIAKDQTRNLFNRFKKEFTSDGSEEENIKLCELVNLMTPENIHLNSFMYEPILDMSVDHLRSLYRELKGPNNSVAILTVENK